MSKCHCLIDKTVEVKRNNTMGLFALSDCNCESDIANNWVLLVSMELFTSSDVKYHMKLHI